MEAEELVHFHDNDFDYDEFVSNLIDGDKILLPECLNTEEAKQILDDRDQHKVWDLFYQREKDPYKPRRYLSAEFTELSNTRSPILLFDVGCGYGSALLPLLKENTSLRAVACDLSETAVNILVKKLSQSDKKRVKACSWDITKGSL